MARQAWDRHGIPPRELFGRLTPSDYVTLFAPPTTASIDRIAELTRVNRERGVRGLKPVFPSWLFNE